MALASHIVNHILEFTADSYGLLYRCSLVNWEFNRAASRLLYFRVVLSPPFQPVLNLKDTGSIPVSDDTHYASGIICHSFKILKLSTHGSCNLYLGNLQFFLCFDRKKCSSRLYTRS